jgi:hypothetical protein
MGPEMVRHFQEVINTLEADEEVRVVVFDSAVDAYFLNHSDFLARLEDLTALPAGPTGLPPWPDFLVRLTRVPVVSRGDRQHQAPRQHQPAAGRRARGRVGCMHRFARATRRPGWDQGADGTRLPQAGGCRKSARILPQPITALGRRPWPPFQ